MQPGKQPGTPDTPVSQRARDTRPDMTQDGRQGSPENAQTRPQPSAAAAAPRGGAPLPEDWPQEPTDPADAPESNAWETAAVPDDIHVSSAVSDEEWASTNWAGTTAARPGTGSGAPGRGTPDGGGSAPQPAAHGASARQPAAGPASPAGADASGSNGTGTPRPGAGAGAYAAASGTNGSSAPGTPSGTQGQESQPGAHQQPAPGQKLSRYQQLLNEAAQRGGSAPSAAVRGNVDLAYVEDVPSADDVTLEDSGLVGRKAIERILGGRLIEERSLDGHGVHR